MLELNSLRTPWVSVLQDLRARGATQIDLIVTDGHDGVLQPSRNCFRPRLVNAAWCISNATSSTRSPGESVPRFRLNSWPIWQQPTKQEALIHSAAFKAKYSKRYPEAVRSLAEEEEHTLTFYAFPAAMHRHIQTTNAIESFFSNVRQHTDQIDVFTSEDRCFMIVWATMQDIRLHKISV